MLHPKKGVHEVLQSFRVGREATPQGLEGIFVVKGLWDQAIKANFISARSFEGKVGVGRR